MQTHSLPNPLVSYRLSGNPNPSRISGSLRTGSQRSSTTGSLQFIEVEGRLRVLHDGSNEVL